MRNVSVKPPIVEYFSPQEMDERLSAAEMSELTDGRMLRSTAVPHCDCMDKTLKGRMRIVPTTGDNLCAYCKHTVVFKVPRGALKHGTIFGYQSHKCRCDLCKTAMAPEWAKRRSKEPERAKQRAKLKQEQNNESKRTETT